jgi:hypothetical protein
MSTETKPVTTTEEPEDRKEQPEPTKPDRPRPPDRTEYWRSKEPQAGQQCVGVNGGPFPKQPRRGEGGW